AIGYTYDQNLEELLPEGYVSAAIAVDTAGKKGFNWIPWPYTLDNGSPRILVQQAGGDKKYVAKYPTRAWEGPVYQLLVPPTEGKAIADAMLASDKDCTFPDGTPNDQMTHCYLSDGELSPGESVKEVTSFDFNTFVYSRMTPAQWLTVMKHSFLLRYYGNRAPLTYGAHPIEYTFPYDSFTLGKPGCNDAPTCTFDPSGNPNNCCQANNFGYRDVVSHSTYTTRQKAMTDFVNWIKGDSTLSKDTYFMSAKQLVDYMKKPFDKSGNAVGADMVATNDSNG